MCWASPRTDVSTYVGLCADAPSSSLARLPSFASLLASLCSSRPAPPLPAPPRLVSPTLPRALPYAALPRSASPSLSLSLAPWQGAARRAVAPAVLLLFAARDLAALALPSSRWHAPRHVQDVS